MFYLAKDAASQKVLAYLVDATDGYSPETGVSSPTIKISKAAGVGNSPNDGTFAELDSTDLPGWYSVQLDATDTDTLGALVIDVFKSGTSRHFTDRGYVLPAKVYNSMFAGTDNLEVDTVQWLGTACATPTTNGVPEVDVTHWGGTAIASAYVQANTVQFAGQTITCAGGVTIPAATLASTTGAVGSVTGAVGSVTAAVTLTADYDAAKTAATQTSVNTIDDFLDTEVAAIKAKTDNLPASPAATGDAMTLAANAINAGAIATGAITAAKFASAAIDAAALAADAGTEIGTAVWASAARTLTAATNVTSTGAAVPITAGGYVSADVKAINAVAVDGAGTAGDPWGPV